MAQRIEAVTESISGPYPTIIAQPEPVSRSRLTGQ
jgi:hypothetical protein